LRTANKRHNRAILLRQSRIDVELRLDAHRLDDGGIRAELIDVAELPGGGRLRLMRHGEDFAIMFGRDQLMGSWVSGSEQALATLVCERLGPQGGRLLIGGLGMGFTLAAALKALPASATIVVSELVPEVVAWASGPLAHIVGASLDDPRVSLEIADVHDVIDGTTEPFDGILMDVDNGPDGLIHIANERLYCNWGLRSAYAALRPGGVLAIWSAYPDGAFGERLEAAGFAIEEIEMAAGGESKARHTIWLAVRPLYDAPVAAMLSATASATLMPSIAADRMPPA
jgi:spermidine synthase